MHTTPANCRSHRLLALGVLFMFGGAFATGTTNSIAGSNTAAQEVRDYSVCKTCDITDENDPEVQQFATVIAEARWSLHKSETGILVMRDQGGKEFAFRWTSSEGSLSSLEPLESEAEQD